MNRFFRMFLCLLILCSCVITTYGQLDSLFRPLSGIRDSTLRITGHLSLKTDSIINTSPTADARDTMAYYRQQVDSISSTVTQQLSNLQEAYYEQFNRINKTEKELQSKLDSLVRQSIPVDDVKRRIDSLQTAMNNFNEAFHEKISGIKESATKKIDALDLPPELQSEVSKVRSSIIAIDPSRIAEKHQLNIPALNASRPTLSTIASAPAIPQSAVTGNVPLSINAPELSGVLPDGIQSTGAIPGTDQFANSAAVKEAMSTSGEAAGELKNLQAQPIDKLADGKLSGIEPVKDVQSQAQIEGIGAVKSEEALKAELERKARAVAVDHFGGQQEQLKAAMEKLAQYKRKYNELAGVSDLNKKPDNPIKKKTFLERTVPGLNLQVLMSGDNVMTDINPYIGYRFSTKITAGAGWNQRVGYNWKSRSFTPDGRVYGPRAFGEYRIGKGFSPRLEMEIINTHVPPATVKTGDPYGRFWVPGVFAGIRKQYKIAGGLSGTASVMFRLFDPKRQSPYGDVVNARFGFEYTFKRKKEQTSGTNDTGTRQTK